MPGAVSVASAIPGPRQGGPDTSGRLPTTAMERHGAMQRLDGQLVLSPTDLTHHQECRHRLGIGPVVALRVSTTGLAAPWCTDARGDGQIPAMLVSAPDTGETHHVLLCTPEQMARFDRVEGRAAGFYELGVLRTGTVTADDGRLLEDVLVYVGGRGRQRWPGPPASLCT
jgi:hypothetical protein